MMGLTVFGGEGEEMGVGVKRSSGLFCHNWCTSFVSGSVFPRAMNKNGAVCPLVPPSYGLLVSATNASAWFDDARACSRFLGQGTRCLGPSLPNQIVRAKKRIFPGLLPLLVAYSLLIYILLYCTVVVLQAAVVGLLVGSFFVIFCVLFPNARGSRCLIPQISNFILLGIISTTASHMTPTAVSVQHLYSAV